MDDKEKDKQKRKTIHGGFKFYVEIGDLQVGGFSEVTGLSAEIEYEEYREGGVNDHMHVLPKGSRFPPIVLKRGMTISSDLWDWYSDVVNGNIERKTGTIELQNIAGEVICRWTFKEGYPVRWSGPELNANSYEVAVESIEIVHRGLTAFATTEPKQ